MDCSTSPHFPLLEMLQLQHWVYIQSHWSQRLRHAPPVFLPSAPFPLLSFYFFTFLHCTPFTMYSRLQSRGTGCDHTHQICYKCETLIRVEQLCYTLVFSNLSRFLKRVRSRLTAFFATLRFSTYRGRLPQKYKEKQDAQKGQQTHGSERLRGLNRRCYKLDRNRQAYSLKDLQQKGGKSEDSLFRSAFAIRFFRVRNPTHNGNQFRQLS